MQIQIGSQCDNKQDSWTKKSCQSVIVFDHALEVILGHIFIFSYLFQVHYFIEPFCVSLKRTLPPTHPLNQILKYHCRETIVPTTFGTPILLGDAGFAAVLFAYGNDGALKLLEDIHPLTSWEVTDFRKNIKVCGNVSSGVSSRVRGEGGWSNP